MPKKKLKLRIKDWLKSKGKGALADSLEFIGENTNIPIVSNFLDKIGEKLQDDKELTPQQIERNKELLMLDRLEVENLTKRLESNNKQGVKLRKLIRLIILVYTWLLLTVLIILYAFGVEMDSTYLYVFEILALTVNGAYFGSIKIKKYRNKKYNNGKN